MPLPQAGTSTCQSHIIWLQGTPIVFLVVFDMLNDLLCVCTTAVPRSYCCATQVPDPRVCRHELGGSNAGTLASRPQHTVCAALWRVSHLSLLLHVHLLIVSSCEVRHVVVAGAEPQLSTACTVLVLSGRAGRPPSQGGHPPCPAGLQ